jgi:outer membrane biosynthesis protein TonB
MSEEINVPEMSQEQKVKFQEVLQTKVNRHTIKVPVSVKGKEPEEEETPKPESELMRKLRLHAEKAYAAHPTAVGPTQEEQNASPCVLTAAAILAAVGIAVYFGHKYWKSYGVLPEELN